VKRSGVVRVRQVAKERGGEMRKEKRGSKHEANRIVDDILSLRASGYAWLHINMSAQLITAITLKGV